MAARAARSVSCVFRTWPTEPTRKSTGILLPGAALRQDWKRGSDASDHEGLHEDRRRRDDGLRLGQRVPKESLRIEAYGTVDELNSQIGAALAAGLERSHPPGGSNDSERALPPGLGSLHPGERTRRGCPAPRIEARHVEALEQLMDRLSQELEPLDNFVLPGGSPGAAALHVARTVCRRAERLVVALSREESVGPFTVPYLNRLSDALFVMARHENTPARPPRRLLGQPGLADGGLLFNRPGPGHDLRDGSEKIARDARRAEIVGGRLDRGVRSGGRLPVGWRRSVSRGSTGDADRRFHAAARAHAAAAAGRARSRPAGFRRGGGASLQEDPAARTGRRVHGDAPRRRSLRRCPLRPHDARNPGASSGGRCGRGGRGDAPVGALLVAAGVAASPRRFHQVARSHAVGTTASA